MDAVFDSAGLSAWAASRPPHALLEVLEVVARVGGAAVVPTVTVVEASTGHGGRDARLNQRLKRVVLDPCGVDRARRAAGLRFDVAHEVSAVDAVVAATAEARTVAVVITSDRKDFAALLALASGQLRLFGV